MSTEPPVPARPRIAYLGTPEVAVPPLEALVEAGFDIDIVLTGPDKRRGRGKSTSPTPVKTAALDAGLEVSHEVDDVVGRGIGLGVVVAFGQIIRPHVLAEVPMINLHFSLLPRWRGAAPVERAILAGDTTTGVCVMDVGEGLDEGGVHTKVEVDIDPDETADELRSRLVAIGASAIVDAIDSGLSDPTPQVGDPVYAHKLDAETLRIDWNRPAIEAHRQVRVGGAWTTLAGERFKIWRARTAEGDISPGRIDGVRVGTSDGLLVLEEVQPAGKPRTAAAAWFNGARLDDDAGFS